MRKLLLSAADERMRPVLELSAVTFRRFARIHNYELRLEDLGPERVEERAGHVRRWGRWRKIDLLLEVLSAYDAVLWMDADAAFSRFDRDILEDVPSSCFQAMVLEQWPSRVNPNSGVWLLRRDPQAYDLLHDVRAHGQLDHSWADQAALCVVMGWHLGDRHGHGAKPLRSSPYLKRTCWLPFEWNPLGRAHASPARVAHMAETEVEERVRLMRAHLGGLRLAGRGTELEGWMGNEVDPPMYIVTAASGADIAGCLVGFATQCGVDPLRFIVFLSKRNKTYRIARSSPALCIHAVPRTRKSLAELFGGATGDRTDKFRECCWRAGPEGVPVLADVTSWFVGRIVDSLDVGDHVGFVLDPIEGAARPNEVLGFQEVRDVVPGHAP